MSSPSRTPVSDTDVNILLVPRRPTDRKKSSPDIDRVTARIGARIAELRKERGLSQSDLAEKIHVSQALLSAYELGKARIGADVVRAIAAGLKVSADDLLDLNGQRKIEDLPNPRILRRLAHFNYLPRRKQDSLLDTIDSVLETAKKKTA